MYCDKRCSNAAYLARPKAKCAKDGCKNPRNAAKGMCKTHYNQTRPNRHRKILKTCDMCGSETVKYQQAQRYDHTYCSLTCRDDATRTTWPSCHIPTDHWARWFGRTSTWRPIGTKAAFFGNQCDDCGESFIDIAHGVPSTYCSDRCQSRVSRRKRRAREYGAPGSYKFSQVMRQYARQGNACAYCKLPAIGLPDPEHVTPISRGGRNDMSNIVASCRACNADKNDLTLEEWAEDRRRRNLPNVDTNLHGPAYTHLMRTQPTRQAWRHLELNDAA